MPYVVNYLQSTRRDRKGNPLPNEQYFLEQMTAKQLRELILKVNSRPDLYVMAEYSDANEYLEDPKADEYITLAKW